MIAPAADILHAHAIAGKISGCGAVLYQQPRTAVAVVRSVVEVGLRGFVCKLLEQ
jgi:hypothetical protein